jgi:hypothetical protein
MSTRHRSRTGAALPEARDQRKAEHRRLRRNVNQALHLAALGDDPDGLVLEDPHPTHGYTDEHGAPDTHADGRPPRRLRHWKQPFWKRRTLERRRRAEMATALVDA